MPDIRREQIRKQTLNDSDKEQGKSHECRSVPIIGGIVSWLVTHPKEGRIGIESVGAVTLIIGLVDAHTILMNGSCSNKQVENKPREEQLSFRANCFEFRH